jgi:endonuclease YncB( thermonuclease family)
MDDPPPTLLHFSPGCEDMTGQRMRFWVAALALLVSGPCWSAETVVVDGKTIQLGGVKYRLDGVDAPEFDQMCIDQKADTWACGVEARNQLTAMIGGKEVRCEDKGADSIFRNRRLGVCTVAGDGGSLNQRLVREGYGFSLEPSGKDRFKAEQAEAKDGQKGLWKGCFAVPEDFRQWKTDGVLLGASCRRDKDVELRQVMFPVEPTAPPGCTIKGKLATRAKFTGNVGIYHLQTCRSYASLTRANRWFCSEDDALAAGFRKAFNCGRRK